MVKNKFEGYYYKHQKDDDFLALIPGCSSEEAFIHVVTKDNAYFATYPRESYSADKHSQKIVVGDSEFTKSSARINIKNGGVCVKAELSYGELLPLSYDIMGFFRFFPMECRHVVVSMSHALQGYADINGKILDFNGGRGYIEGDSGTSFPSKYSWLHCNDFDGDTSIMASIAKIPFAGFVFNGCICAITFQGKQYRLATYKGVKILRNSAVGFTLRQGKYLLEVDISPSKSHNLPAPAIGKMNRLIKEAPLCKAEFKFFHDGNLIFCKTSERASFEFAE